MRLSIATFLLLTSAVRAQERQILSLLATVDLPNVGGRIDHFGYDPSGQRIFVAALGNRTVEVIDVKTAKRVHTISDLAEPQAGASGLQATWSRIDPGCRRPDSHRRAEYG